MYLLSVHQSGKQPRHASCLEGSPLYPFSRIKTWHMPIFVLVVFSAFVCLSPRLGSSIVLQLFLAERVAYEVPSPSGRHVAMIVVSGSPFQPPEMKVNLREGKGWLGIGELRFGIGDDQWLLAVNRTPEINVQWLNETTLLIEYDGELLYKWPNSWKEIGLVYRQMEREGVLTPSSR